MTKLTPTTTVTRITPFLPTEGPAANRLIIAMMTNKGLSLRPQGLGTRQTRVITWEEVWELSLSPREAVEFLKSGVKITNGRAPVVDSVQGS